jgi:hypothetical protein
MTARAVVAMSMLALVLAVVTAMAVAGGFAAQLRALLP